SLVEHQLCLKEGRLEALSDVFLVDHAWTTRFDKAEDELNEVPGLLNRMESLTGIYEPTEEISAMPETTSLDATMSINAPVVASQAGVSEEKARDLLRRTRGDIVDAIVLANDESAGTDSAQKEIQNTILEQLSGKDGASDQQALEWTTRKYSCAQYSLDDGDQLDAIDISVPIPPYVKRGDIKCKFSQKHILLSISDNVVVDGDFHADVSSEEATWTLDKGLLVITLIKKRPEHWPVAIIGERHISPKAHKKHILHIYSELWRYFQGYDYAARGLDRNSLVKYTNWYIQDEVGLAIGHSDSPNVRSLPFIYLDNQGNTMPFNIVWPIESITQGQPLTRDYCPRWLTSPEQRKGYLQAVFKGPKQPVLDAYKALVEEWSKVAGSAGKACLTATPVLSALAKNVYVFGASDKTKKDIEEAGLCFTGSADSADVVFDNGDEIAGKTTSKHPLNSVFSSDEITVKAFQAIVGAKQWLCPGFDMKSQICEFIGAALMDSNSWWLLRSGQAERGILSQTMLTNDWAAAVRHVDVGYTTAVKCALPAISSNHFYVVEKRALLTPNNELYIWGKDIQIYRHEIRMNEKDPDPYQALAAAEKVPKDILAQLIVKQFGKGAFDKLDRDADAIVADVIRLLLNEGNSDNRNFGLFSFAFTLGRHYDAISPFLYRVKPVSVLTGFDDNEKTMPIVPAVVAALSGRADPGCWRQIKS
ncbi:hypothetical protein H4217_004139, partial [Coemansia sp. RSA 1939]